MLSGMTAMLSRLDEFSVEPALSDINRGSRDVETGRHIQRLIPLWTSIGKEYSSRFALPDDEPMAAGLSVGEPDGARISGNLQRIG